MSPVLRLSVALCFPLLVACQSVQTTGGGAVGVERKQYMFLPAQQVDSLYAQAYQETLSKANQEGVLDSSSRNAKRVSAIAQRLIPQVAHFRQDALQWDWQVNLIKSDEINANCGPGGKIIVYTGIIEKLQLSDDELAAVMGHEIAHALREHSREAMSQAYGTQMLTGIGAALLGLGETGQQLANTGVDLLMTKPNSRSNENEADLIGIELAARAGFNPNAAITLWQKMAQASAGAPPEFMSTHPSSTRRIESLSVAIPKVMPLYQQSAK